MLMGISGVRDRTPDAASLPCLLPFGSPAMQRSCRSRPHRDLSETLGPDQLSDLINSVHRAIGQLGQPPELEEIRTPAVSVRRSVHQDYVICLDCGYRGKRLRRHIRTRHGLGRDEYLRRWGLRSNHPLMAPAYSGRRSTLAKSLGLGRKAPIEAARPETPTAAPAPTASITGSSKAKRTRKSRTPPKSECVSASK
jgi:predicted transcriptional regulator